MSEEQAEAENTPTENDQPSYEERATKDGWTNKKVWTENGKDPDEWKSARNFVKAGETIAANKKLHSDVTELKTKLSNFIEVTEAQNITDQEYQKAQLEQQKAQFEQRYNELKTERDSAIEDGEVAQVNQIEQQMHTIATQHNKLEQPQQTAQSSQGLKDAEYLNNYIAENPWINEDSLKSNGAIAKALQYRQKGMSLEVALSQMEKDIEKEFPKQKDSNPNRDKVSITQTGSSGKRSAASLSFSDLTHSENELFTKMYKRDNYSKDAWEKKKSEFLVSAKKYRQEAQS